MLPIGTSLPPSAAPDPSPPATLAASGPTPVDARDPQRLGAEVRLARKRQGLTQVDLADAIGVHRRVIGELERGKATVQLGIALAAASAVGLDVQLVPRR